MSRVFSLVCLAASYAVISAANVSAQTFNTTFSDPTFTCLNSVNPTFCNGSSNGREAAFIQSSGDFWNQTIAGSGLGTVSSLSLNLTMVGNLTGASMMQYDILLNGTVVGQTSQYSQTGGFDIVSPFTFNFAGISAATYNVKVRANSATTTFNNEGMALLLDGSPTIAISGTQTTVTPEPGTYALMLSGLAGVGVVARRRRSHR